MTIQSIIPSPTAIEEIETSPPSETVIYCLQDLETTHLISDIYDIHHSIQWDKYNDIVLRYFARMPERSFIAVKNHKIIGYVILDLKHIAPERIRPYIPYIAIHQVEHRKGIGTLLMLQVLRKTYEIGETLLQLECLPSRCYFYQSIPKKAHTCIEEFSITYNHFINGYYPNGEQEHDFIFQIKEQQRR